MRSKALGLALLLSLALAGCGGPKTNPDQPMTYMPLCQAALTQAQSQHPEIFNGAALQTQTPPRIILKGPPARVQCWVSRVQDHGFVVFETACDDPSSDRCVAVTTGALSGRFFVGSRAMTGR